MPIIPLFSPAVKPWKGQKSGAFREFSGGFDQNRPEGRIQCAIRGLEIGDRTVNFYHAALKYGLTGAGKRV
jgi:hypothetical protein